MAATRLTATRAVQFAVPVPIYFALQIIAAAGRNGVAFLEPVAVRMETLAAIPMKFAVVIGVSMHHDYGLNVLTSPRLPTRY